MKKERKGLRPHIFLLIFFIAPFLTATKITSIESIVTIWTEPNARRYNQTVLALVLGNLSWVGFLIYLLISR